MCLVPSSAPICRLQPLLRLFSTASASASSATANERASTSVKGVQRTPNRADRSPWMGRLENTATYQAKAGVLQVKKGTAAAASSEDATAAAAAAAAPADASVPPSPIDVASGVSAEGTSGYTTLETIPGSLVYTGRSALPVAPLNASVFRSKSSATSSPSKRRNIPISPQKLNDICRMVRGVNVQEALIQLKLSQKKRAYLVAHTIATAAAHGVNTHNMERSRLYVSQLWVGHGSHLKRLDIKGRGRSGLKKRYRSHLFVEVREQGADPEAYKGVWKHGGRSHDMRTGEEIRIGRAGRRISTIQRTLEHMQQWRTARGMTPKPDRATRHVDAKRAFRAQGIATDHDAIFGAQNLPPRTAATAEE